MMYLVGNSQVEILADNRLTTEFLLGTTLSAKRTTLDNLVSSPTVYLPTPALQSKENK